MHTKGTIREPGRGWQPALLLASKTERKCFSAVQPPQSVVVLWQPEQTKTVPRLIYRLSAIPIEISADFFGVLLQADSKTYLEMQANSQK